MTAAKYRTCVGRARYHGRPVYLALAAVVVPVLLSSTLVCGAGIDLAEKPAGSPEKDSPKLLTEQVCREFRLNVNRHYPLCCCGWRVVQRSVVVTRYECVPQAAVSGGL